MKPKELSQVACLCYILLRLYRFLIEKRPHLGVRAIPVLEKLFKLLDSLALLLLQRLIIPINPLGFTLSMRQLVDSSNLHLRLRRPELPDVIHDALLDSLLNQLFLLFNVLLSKVVNQSQQLNEDALGLALPEAPFS